MPRRTAAYEIAMDVLADGRWHPYEWTLYEVAKRIPPNLAVHRAERDRVAQWLKEHPNVPKELVPPRSQRDSIDYQVKVGSRSLAREVLMNVAFEHVRHVETKQRLIRVFPAKAPTPPPPGYEHFLKNRSKFIGMTPEEARKYRSARSQKGHDRVKALKGPGYLTQAERARKRKEEWAKLSPEQKKQIRSEAARRGHLKRKANEQEGD